MNSFALSLGLFGTLRAADPGSSARRSPSVPPSAEQVEAARIIYHEARLPSFGDGGS